MKKQNKVLITGASGFVGVIFKTILKAYSPDVDTISIRYVPNQHFFDLKSNAIIFILAGKGTI
jgi:nucleoside-diphosphate-sugar epimerase